jgi:O-antigen/teichoic acid export membrane protein
MTNTNEAAQSSLIKTLYQSLLDHIRIPLFANAYALIANQVLTAGLGVLYWIVTARLYSAEAVGENSAILSTVLFIAMLAELTFKAGATRFVPRAGKKTPVFLLAALGINLTAAFVIGLFIVTVGKNFSLTAELMENIDFWPGWLVLGGMVWCVFYVQDGILTGFRQAKWVAIKNTFHSVTKLLLLFVFYHFISNYGIVLSWFSPVIFIVAAIYILIFWRLIPRASFGDNSQSIPITKNEVIRSISGDYVGSLLVETCVRIMPLLVLQQLGSRSTAYYYQAWTVATPIYMVASSMMHSFVVEASANMNELPKISRKILKQMILLIVPAVLVVFLGARRIMSLFGSSYASESTRLLQWLVLATLPLIINYWFLSYARVTGNGKSIIVVQGVTSVVALTVSAIWISKGGITTIGIAWFAAQSVIAIPVMFKSASLLFKQLEQEPKAVPAKLNTTLRRVDWRFLFSQHRQENAICFSSNVELHNSLSLVFSHVDDYESVSLLPVYDLAVAINPGKKTLRTAANAIRADGVLYTMWNAWRLGGQKVILRRLHAMGFSDVKMYIPFPSPDSARVWIPLDAPDVTINYIASWLFPNKGWLQRLGIWSTKKTLHFALRTGLVPSLCAFGTKRTFQVPDTFSRFQCELTRSFPEITADRLSYLVQTPGNSSENKIVFLVFLDSEPNPKWVVKIPRLSKGTPSLVTEWDLLKELKKAVQANTETLIVPEPVFKLKLDERQAFCQTSVTGVPLQQIIRTRDMRAIALQLTQWQIVLAKISRGWSHEISSIQFIENLLVGIEFELGGHTELSETFAETRHLLLGLGDVPITCMHNDFTVWNIRQNDNQLGVFDWTDASRSGLPLLDLVYGLTSMFLLQDKAWESSDHACRVYMGLLDASTPKGAIFNESLQLYGADVGLRHGQIAFLRLLTWVLNVKFDLQFQRQEMGCVPRPYDSMYFRLWKTELYNLKQSLNIYPLSSE